MPINTNRATQHLNQIEQQILYEVGTTAITWMGITIAWKALALKNGGHIKRKQSYGTFTYYYRNNEITREEALKEATKPPSLRQALIEAETSIECTMCGLVVVGKEALEPYRDWIFYNGIMYSKPKWGLIFLKMENNDPEYLNLCPNCIQRIIDGEFRNL